MNHPPTDNLGFNSVERKLHRSVPVLEPIEEFGSTPGVAKCFDTARHRMHD